MSSFFSRQYFKEQVDKGEYEKFNTTVDTIEIFYHPTQFRVHIFTGRKKKPDSVLYKSLEIMLLNIDTMIEKAYKRKQQKIEQKERDKVQAEEARKSVNVGDIFSTSWGYDRTIVDFFEVVERVSNAYVNIRQINAVTVSSDAMSARIKPIPGDYSSDVKKCQINKYGHIVNADEYGHTAYKTDADSDHYTSWD